jgi:hypothetical protein
MTHTQVNENRFSIFAILSLLLVLQDVPVSIVVVFRLQASSHSLFAGAGDGAKKEDRASFEVTWFKQCCNFHAHNIQGKPRFAE